LPLASLIHPVIKPWFLGNFVLSEHDANLAIVPLNLIKAKDSNLEEQGKELWMIINILAICNRLALFGSDHDHSNI